jgi:hypothetical protein
VPQAHAGRAADRAEPSDSERQRTMTWAQRLKRVFAIEIDTCERCGGRLRVIASIEDRVLIERILHRLGRDEQCLDPAHPGRAPPPSR